MVFNIKGKVETKADLFAIENPELNDTYLCNEDDKMYVYRWEDAHTEFLPLEPGELEENSINISDKCVTCDHRACNGFYNCIEECEEPFNVLNAVQAMRKATSTRLFGGLL